MRTTKFGLKVLLFVGCAPTIRLLWFVAQYYFEGAIHCSWVDSAMGGLLALELANQLAEKVLDLTPIE